MLYQLEALWYVRYLLHDDDDDNNEDDDDDNDGDDDDDYNDDYYYYYDDYYDVNDSYCVHIHFTSSFLWFCISLLFFLLIRHFLLNFTLLC